MQAIQYHLLAQVEEQHWWHRTLRRAVAEMLAKFGDGRRLAMLDAGCGTGGLLAALRDRHSVYGLDFSSLALSYSKTRGLDRLAGGRVDRMPFGEASFDAVVSVDVLSHRSIPSDYAAVCEIQRVLRPGGLFVLQLSAFERLRGAHDESVHQARRYTRRQVTDLLE
ncbi:MAG: class I SAM-dependent methyltransferase, partial [Acidobacteriota bacterium]